MKVCNTCKNLQGFESFSRNKNSKDGKEPICKACNKVYKDSIKERQKLYDFEYKLINKDKLKISDNLYRKKRRQNNLHFRLSDNLRSRLFKVVNGLSKSTSILKLLGCSVNDFKIYIEKQFKPEMTWENYGKIWEIDHIIPCASFDLTDIEQQKQCFNYLNTQPLFKTTNIAEKFGYINEIGNRDKSDNI